MKDDVKKILILGNTGFIGGCLEGYLANKFSNIEVVGYSTKDIDLMDKQDIQKLTKDFDLNTVVVMCSMVKKEFGDNLDNYKKNLMMAIYLCRMLETHPVKRFIYLSSAAVYGEDIENTNITEKTNVNPTSYYGMAKYASENLFQKVIGAKKESTLLVLRPPLIYGEKDRSQAYGPAGFIKKALMNEEIVLWGDGRELREFIYIGDLINVIGRNVLGGYEGVVNVMSGTKYCFKDILDIIEKQLQITLNIKTKERSKTKADHCFDNSLIMELYPNISFTSLERGVQNIIEIESSLAK